MNADYKKLLEKYNLLLEENKRLKTELAFLKGEDSLFIHEPEKTTIFSKSTINKYSQPGNMSVKVLTIRGLIHSS